MRFYIPIFVASLLGSLHCASMCGPFAAFALMRDARRGAWLIQALYHGGRLLAYATLGAVAGAFGATLDFGGSLLGIGRVAGVAAGAMGSAWGVPMPSSSRAALADSAWSDCAVPSIDPTELATSPANRRKNRRRCGSLAGGGTGSSGIGLTGIA